MIGKPFRSELAIGGRVTVGYHADFGEIKGSAVEVIGRLAPDVVVDLDVYEDDILAFSLTGRRDTALHFLGSPYRGP